MYKQEPDSSWKLTNRTLDVLEIDFPESSDVLRCLRNDDSESVPPEHDQLRTDLAIMIRAEWEKAEQKLWDFTRVEILEDQLGTAELSRSYGWFVKGDDRLYQMRIMQDSSGETPPYIRKCCLNLPKEAFERYSICT